jgi:hypothetical protein
VEAVLVVAVVQAALLSAVMGVPFHVGRAVWTVRRPRRRALAALTAVGFMCVLCLCLWVGCAQLAGIAAPAGALRYHVLAVLTGHACLLLPALPIMVRALSLDPMTALARASFRVLICPGRSLQALSRSTRTRPGALRIAADMLRLALLVRHPPHPTPCQPVCVACG